MCSWLCSWKLSADCDTITVTVVKGSAPFTQFEAWNSLHDNVPSPTDRFGRDVRREGDVAENSTSQISTGQISTGQISSSQLDAISPEDGRDLLTLDELTARVGMSVRNVRFYTSKGLVPPPIRRGRSGYYGPEHVARLELVQELQGHGFTLAAIEKYLATMPPDASAEDVALTRTLLAPWMLEQPVLMTRDQLASRAGRELSDDDLDVLAALDIATCVGEDRYRVAPSQLSVGFGLLELGYPAEAAAAAQKLYRRHGQEIADELYELFRTQVWPRYRESGMTSERLAEVVERLKPLSVTSLVTAYEQAMDERRREGIKRRAGTAPSPDTAPASD